MITFRQCRTGVASPPTGREIEARYRCIDARHEPVTYNPVHDKTWCLCGRVIRDGDHSRWPTRYEYAEADAARTDLVGREARAYLREVHGEPEPPAVPTAYGEQFVLEVAL
ncbi:hypothetical protein [Nocardia farcinica]|uniref:hypothetical protein n=1 Tax=Nocardia farcinica TaxID=37329 RepID=UPI0018951DAF|nr:hypothetical protein [Nocardia farcinica]MBF6254447.1 hypothetical protein [Nocardia farcinica]